MLTLPPPGTTSVAWSPVTVEAPGWLTGCELPDGRGLLVWVNANRVRFAVTAGARAWLGDGIVEAGDIGTVVSADGVFASSTFTSGGNVYVAAFFSVGSTGYQRIYRAVDPVNPAGGWTVHGTPQVYAIGSAGSILEGGHLQAGIPHIVGSTWVYTGTAWREFFGNRFGIAGLWHSTDGGATWAEKIAVGFGPVGGSYTTHISPGIIVDAVTGVYYWTAVGGPAGDDGRLYQSTDGGASWTLAVSTPLYLAPVTRSGGSTFVADVRDGTTYTMPALPAPALVPFSSHVPLGGSAGRAVGAAGMVFLFSSSTVQAAAGGWQVDACGFS